MAEDPRNRQTRHADRDEETPNRLARSFGARSAAMAGRRPPPPTGTARYGRRACGRGAMPRTASEVVAPPESPYDRPGSWYVVHTYAGYENKVKSNLESRHLLDEHGGPHLRGRHPARGRRRAEERQAPGRLPQGVPWLPDGPHGPGRRFLVRGAQHARGYRVRRPGRPADAAVPGAKSRTSWQSRPRAPAPPRRPAPVSSTKWASRSG